MGWFSDNKKSTSNTTNNITTTHTNDGFNETNGTGNAAFSGIGSVGDVSTNTEINYLDGGAIDSTFDFLDSAVDNYTDSSNKLVGGVLESNNSAIDSSLEFAGASMDNFHDLGSKTLDVANNIAMGGFDFSAGFADKQNDFMSDVFDSYSDRVNDNSNKAFNAMGNAAIQLGEATKSESAKVTDTFIKYASYTVMALGLSFAVSKAL